VCWRTVASSGGHAEFNGELLNTFKDWRYKPAMVGGKPVAIWYIIQIKIGK
jgi:outer membrane biosynthesis protein TonB